MAVTALSNSLTNFSREVDELNLMPLWERSASAMKPGTNCVPFLWRYSQLREKLMEAATLINERDAERRVLVLENPNLRGSTYITNTLYAGLQIILPGEVAPSHRHTPNALRFVVEGEGAYTAVGGERATMRPGDFVVTPNWQWHDHGNLGTGPVIWMDGLDTPFPKFFGATFREDHAEEQHEIVRAEGESFAAYGANMLPLDFRPQGLESPILLYPYDRSRESLQRLLTAGRIDPAHGVKLKYVNPANGQYPFPTMGVFMQLLPAGFAGTSYRSTDGAIFNVVEGEGTVVIGDQTMPFSQHDVFVVPPWSWYRFSASKETVLFSYSDRAAQEALGFWQEEATT